MKNLILVAFLLTSIYGSIAQPKFSDRESILNIMEQQENCWNNGNLECFMEGYWKSDSLKFIGKKGLTFGWNKTLDNYRESYPSKEKMGKLSFDIISIEPLGEQHVLLIGKWKLDWIEDVLEGHYSLTWKKIAGEWKIIADHSS